MTTIYTIHVQLPAVARALVEQLEDRHELKIKCRKDAGWVYLETEEGLVDLPRIRAFCDGYMACFNDIHSNAKKS